MKIMAHIGLQRIPGPAGERFAARAGHGSMRGEADSLMRDKRHHGTVGDAFFVAAGAAHRFEKTSEDFVTGVVFYGPEGGETE